MSIFNTAVPPHVLTPFLLMAIRWGQPKDPEKRYPLMGRMRYAWLNEDGSINILLKDGPESWSEGKDEVMEQIRRHETLVSVNTLERDPVYLVATFRPVETHFDEGFLEFWKNEFVVQIKKANEEMIKNGHCSVYEHPFDIFDRVMQNLSAGKSNLRINNLMNNIVDVIKQSDAEAELKKMTSDAGITGMDSGNVKVFTVDEGGNINDETDKYLKNDEKN